MKILIIEDDEMPAFLMMRALSDFGEVEFCMKDGLMPTIEEIRVKVLEADMILLDDDLRTSYRGRDLLPFCAGKIVVGTSTQTPLGSVQFTGKGCLSMSPGCIAAQDLRKLVANQLGIDNV
jgi:hypothetical protein